MAFARTLFALSIIVAFTSAQLQTFPPCALECIATSNLDGCLATDETCLCKDGTFLASSSACIKATCTGSDLTQAKQASISLCAALGVTLSVSSSSTSAPPSPSAPPTPVTSTYPGGITSTPSGTSSDKSSTSASKQSILGPIIGGAVGGVVLIALVITAVILCLRKRRRTSREIEQEPKNPFDTAPLQTQPLIQSMPQPSIPFGYTPSPEPSTTYDPSFTHSQPPQSTFPHGYTGAPEMSSSYDPHFNQPPPPGSVPYGYTGAPEVPLSQQDSVPYGYTGAPELPSVYNNPTFSNSQTSSTPMMASAYLGINPSESGSNSMIYEVSSSSSGSGMRSAPPTSEFLVSNPSEDLISNSTMSSSKKENPLKLRTPSPAQSNNPSGLTEEQAQFVRELRSMNVPTTEIASLMDTMRKERQGGVGGGGGGGGEEGGSWSKGDMKVSSHVEDLEAPPPRYDFKGV